MTPSSQGAVIETSIRRGFKSAIAALGVAACLILADPANADVAPLGQIGVGTAGSAPGQLVAPGGVAVDAAGMVYVADSFNRRISVFTGGGTFLRAFGFDVIPGGGGGLETCTTSCQAGASGGGPGQFNFPSSVAIDEVNDLLYVSDAGNHRISVFTSQGDFIRATGWNTIPGGPVGYESCTTSCQAADPGGGSGQLNSPRGLATDAAGNVFVADENNHRISVYDAEGGFVHTFGWDVGPDPFTGFEICTLNCQAGDSGGGAGQLDAPRALGTNAVGTLFVAEQDTHRISVFDAQRNFLRAFGFDVIPGAPAGLEACTATCQPGLGGHAAGQLNEPEGVASDGAGNLFVSDTGNDRISVFTAQGTFLHAFGFDVNPSGSAGFETCTVSCQVADSGANPGQFAFPTAAATDCRGALYVTDGNNHRIQRFGEPTTALPPCRFTIGKLKRNTKRGTAKLAVEVPGAGELNLSAKKVNDQSKQAAAAGTVTLAVKAKGKAKRKLAKQGKLTVKLSITFTPNGGEPSTKTKKAKLKRRG